MPEYVTERQCQEIRQRPDQLLPLHSCIRIFRQRMEGDDAWTSGILMDVSRELLLLQVISDQINLNGFQIIRRSDISHIERPIPQQDFLMKALKLRGQEPQHPGIINLDSIEKALRTVARLKPLVTVYQEITDPSVCWIGRMNKIDNDLLYLQCISPEARLEGSLDMFDIESITRIDFGGSYEDALWQVYNAS